MKREHLNVKMHIVRFMLKNFVFDEGVCYDSALYALLLNAMCCVDNALEHLSEYKEYD